MSTDELSPERQEHLIGQMLRERGGIDSHMTWRA